MFKFVQKGPDTFQRVDNNQIAKIYWRNSKSFLWRSTGLLKQTSQNASRGKGDSSLFNKGQIAKIHWRKLKIFTIIYSFQEPLGQYQFKSNLAQSLRWWRGLKVTHIKDNTIFKGEIIMILQTCIDDINLKLIFHRANRSFQPSLSFSFELVSPLSDVTYGPLDDS